MKKLTLIIGIFFIYSTINYCLGQASQEINKDGTTKEIKIEDISYNGLSSINTYFCNEGFTENKIKKDLNIKIRPGEEKEICIIKFNLSSGDIYSRSAFPDSRTYSEGRFCSDDNSRTNAFSKFIKPFSEEKIKIPAKGYTIRRTTIKFPLGTSGMQYGCLAYGEAEKPQQYGGMINIIKRKINNITIDVVGKDLSKIETIKHFFLINKQIIIYILFIIVLIVLLIEIFNLKKVRIKH